MKMCRRCRTVVQDDEPICPECYCRAFIDMGDDDEDY